MRKYQLLISVLALSIIGNTNIYAHTINQHLEELYGETYLPLFVLARLLPFIGLGMLAFNTNTKRFKIKWYFIIVLAVGVFLGFFIEVDGFIYWFNNLSVIASGIILLTVTKSEKKWLYGLLVIFGITLGFEHGIYIAHTQAFRWLYLMILASDLMVFLLLSSIQFIGHPRRKMIVYFTGIFLILFGIGSVLLA
jgi:hydrogenase/urease accessory protein HupE